MEPNNNISDRRLYLQSPSRGEEGVCTSIGMYTSKASHKHVLLTRRLTDERLTDTNTETVEGRRGQEGREPGQV